MTTSTGPSVRAKFTQLTLKDLAKLGPETEGRIRKLLPADSLRRIESAGGLEWIPVALDVELTRAMFLVMGREEARRYFRDNLMNAAESPILSSFIHGALRLFGVTPATLVKIAPRGWAQIFRDCGELEPELRGPREAALRWRRIPAVILESRPWVDGVAGSLEACFHFCQTRGRIEVDRTRIDAGELTLTFTWE